MELAQAGLTMGRPLLAPPGVDQPKIDFMRKTLTSVFGDRDFLQECQKLRLDCNAPLTGKEMTDFVERIYQMPKSARDRIAEIYMQGQSN